MMGTLTLPVEDIRLLHMAASMAVTRGARLEAKNA